MNSFNAASELEKQSLGVLIPMLLEMFDGNMLATNSHSHSADLQKTCGDFLARKSIGDVIGLEMKAEMKHTGNVFIETWSNRKWFASGWLFTSKADYILYHFLDSEVCYVISMRGLKTFCHITESPKTKKPGRLLDYPEVPQKKYDQLNDTWGRLIPVGDLKSAQCLKEFWTKADGLQFRF